MTSIFHYRNN